MSRKENRMKLARVSWSLSAVWGTRYVLQQRSDTQRRTGRAVEAGWVTASAVLGMAGAGRRVCPAAVERATQGKRYKKFVQAGRQLSGGPVRITKY